jgi:exodeoxyribonuclease-3
MRIVSWNVNSIRSRRRAVTDLVERHRPDVLLLQETKCDDDTFPADDLTTLGYEVVHHGRDQWNGVAIASRVGLDHVWRGFEDGPAAPFDEPRLVSATCAGVRVHSVYVPNGRSLDDPHYVFKLDWLALLRRQLAADLAAGVPTVVGGDFNVAPADADIYDPARWRHRTHASPPERAAIAALVDLGLCDIVRVHHPGPGLYTWWSYRPGQFERNNGLRIDMFLVSADVATRTVRAWVDVDTRGEARPSDHAPVVLDLEDVPGVPDAAVTSGPGASDDPRGRTVRYASPRPRARDRAPG